MAYTMRRMVTQMQQQEITSLSCSLHSTGNFQKPVFHQTNSLSEEDTWHFRLGHLSFERMRKLCLPCNQKKHSTSCSICPQAKLHKQPFPLSTSRASRIFELIHVDIWGAYKCSTYNGYKYFLTIVDDYSRATWVHLMSCNSNAFPLLQSFVAYIENQFAVSVKVIRSDNGEEFKDRSTITFYAEKGILH